MRLLALLFLIASSVPGAAIFYDGSYVPQPGAANFHWAVFGNTWGTDGNILSIHTSYVTGGIWFGYHPAAYGNPGWSLGTDAQGQYVKIRARLTPGSTEWSIYMHNGTSMSNFYLLNDAFQYSVPDTGGGTTANIFANMNVFRDYEIWMKGGKVVYKVDNTVWYAGNALPSGANLLIIGDGSGSTITGTGTMQIDSATILTGLDFVSAPAMPLAANIPEPSSFLLCGAGLLAAARLRRRAN
jgi:hypothetical protein